jgi:hypothetical protein
MSLTLITTTLSDPSLNHPSDEQWQLHVQVPEQSQYKTQSHHPRLHRRVSQHHLDKGTQKHHADGQ